MVFIEHEKCTFWSLIDPPGLWGEAKLSYELEDIKKGEAKPGLSKHTSVFYHFPSVSPKQLCASAQLKGNAKKKFWTFIKINITAFTGYA